MKWSISAKILLPMGTLFLLFLVLQISLLNRSTQDILLDKSKNRAFEIADNAILALEADLRMTNFVRVATSLASSDEIRFVIFIDRSTNKIIASSSYHYRKEISELDPSIKARVEKALESSKWQFEDLGNNDLWFSYNIRTVPQGTSEIKNYLMLIEFSGESVNQAIAETNELHFIYLSVGALIFALLGYLLLRQFTLMPLTKLKESVTTKKPGEPYRGLHNTGNDEFKVLADALYEMSTIEIESLKAMAQAKQKAEDMADLKSAFLANMSHEIRTPINGILGLVQVAQQSDSPEQIQQYLKKIFLSGRTLVGIVNDILDFSKIAAGKINIENIPFCPDQLVEQVLELCMNNANSKGLILQADLAEDLPLIISSDPLRLEQVLLNLVNNAVKFTEEGSVTISISVVKKDKSHFLQVSVRDTGIGIEKEKQKDLFEEFVQADGSTTRKYGGTGLGLSISKNLVQLMGGELSVKSEFGAGSTFGFEIPVDISAQHEIHEKLRKVVSQVSVEADNLDSAVISKPMLTLISRIQKMSKGQQIVRIISLGQYLDGGVEDERFTLVVGANEALMGSRQTKQNVHPLYTSVNRESLVNLLASAKDSSRVDTQIGEEQEIAAVQSSYKVLLVEDNAINAEVILAMLNDNAYQITHVENGQLALDHLAKDKVDLVLMDVQMPIMDGYTATTRIREQLKLDVPIVGLSANVLPEEVQKARELGMNDYLAKPVIREALFDKVHQWLQ